MAIWMRDRACIILNRAKDQRVGQDRIQRELPSTGILPSKWVSRNSTYLSSNREPPWMEKESRQSHSLTNMDLNLTSEMFPVNRRNSLHHYCNITVVCRCRIQCPSQDWTQAPALGTQSLSDWPPWKFPRLYFKIWFFYFLPFSSE